MDISRIEAYNPSRIDWKRLTAKEIMQYKNRGVEVPDIYLQWANDFLNTVEAQRNDQITYESAEAQARNQTTEHARKSNGELVPTGQNSIDGSETGDEEVQENENAPQVSIEQAQNTENAQGNTENSANKPLSASELREKMKKEGASVIDIASTFKGISDTNSANSIESTDTSNNIQATSSNIIEELESDMQDLMSQIDEAKNEIKNIAPKADDQGALARINQLQAEINALGESGISELVNTEATFDEYDAILEQQAGIGETAQEYGAETVSAGKDAMIGIFFDAFGRNVISSGAKAIAEGTNAINAQNEASNTNQESQSRLNALESDMEAKTGINIVRETETEENTEENNTEETLTNKAEEKPESEKAVKTSQNDGTDNTDKANTDVNEIIKRKIRRGENMG